jgi:hypothetical protein
LMASESATQLVTGVGGAGAVELRQPMRDWGSYSPNHGVKDDDCCGGGRVDEGTACLMGKPYWSAAKKVCDVDQYGAPPMDGSKDDQAGALATVPAGAQGLATPIVVPVGAPATAVVA